jgi:hypothetical protein
MESAQRQGLVSNRGRIVIGSRSLSPAQMLDEVIHRGVFRSAAAMMLPLGR